MDSDSISQKFVTIVDQSEILTKETKNMRRTKVVVNWKKYFVRPASAKTMANIGRNNAEIAKKIL